jgi:hypothetical protein
MGQADYYLEGAFNFFCMECGKKLKSTEGLFRWDNVWVGPECFEIRNPGDFVRGIPDNPSVPWRGGAGPDMKLSAPPPTTTVGCVANQPGRKFMLIGSWMLDSQLLE